MYIIYMFHFTIYICYILMITICNYIFKMICLLQWPGRLPPLVFDHQVLTLRLTRAASRFGDRCET